MNILTIIILGIYIILGGGSTIALTGYMFVVIAQKIIRKNQIWNLAVRVERFGKNKNRPTANFS